MKIDNSLESRLSLLLCALVAIVPFLWHGSSLTAPVIYKQLAIEITSMFLAAFCLFYYAKKKQVFTLNLPVIIWPVFAFHAMAVVSVLWAVDAGASLVQLIHMFGLFLLFALATFTAYMRPAQFSVMLIRISVAAAVVLSLLGLAQNFGYLENLFYQVTPPAATMVNQNVLAQYLDTILFPALLMIFWSEKKRDIYLSAVAFSVLFAMLLLTYTRGAWLGGIVGLVALAGFVMAHKQVRQDCLDHALLKNKYVATTVALMTALIVMALPSPVNLGSFQSKFLDAIEQPEDGSSSLRRAMYTNSWPMFEANLLGVGIGNWRNMYPLYHQALQPTPGYGLKMQPRNLHNDPYRFLIETGVFGGLSFVAILLLMVWTVWRMLSGLNYSRQQRMLLLSVFLSLLGAGTHSLVSFPFDSPASAMQIWLWLGVLGGLSLHYGKQHAEQNQIGGSLFTCSLRLNRMHAGLLLALLLPGLLVMLWYQGVSLHGSELERKAEILFKSDKCAESLPFIDASVETFSYAYTATMRRSMYHAACDPDRKNTFAISLELLGREPYYLNLLLYILPSALENGRLDVVADVAGRLVHVYPDLPDGYHWQGMLAGGKGDYKKARRLFTQALQKDADFKPSKTMLKTMHRADATTNKQTK